MIVHNFQKLNVLEACNTINKFEMICISKLYLDLSVFPNNHKQNIKLVRANHLKKEEKFS